MEFRDADILARASATRDEFEGGRDYAAGDKACSQAVLRNRRRLVVVLQRTSQVKTAEHP